MSTDAGRRSFQRIGSQFAARECHSNAKSAANKRVTSAHKRWAEDLLVMFSMVIGALWVLLRSRSGKASSFGKGLIMRISKFRLAVAGGLMAISFSFLGAGTAYAIQGHMFNARDNLNGALNELQLAVPDKGGHRVNAIHLVDQAIDEVNAGIAVGAGQ